MFFRLTFNIIGMTSYQPLIALQYNHRVYIMRNLWWSHSVERWRDCLRATAAPSDLIANPYSPWLIRFHCRSVFAIKLTFRFNLWHIWVFHRHCPRGGHRIVLFVGASSSSTLTALLGWGWWWRGDRGSWRACSQLQFICTTTAMPGEMQSNAKHRAGDR